MDKNKRRKTFYLTTLIAGFLLIMLEVGIYRKTMIPLRPIIVVISLTSIFTFLLIKNDYRDIYQKKSFFFPFFQSAVSFGFIACYIFVASNFYFTSSSDPLLRSFPILTKHTIGTRSPQPAIEINYEGIEKQLVFYTEEQNAVDTAKYVLLTIKKGLFGYDIFSDVQLK
jgi:hypothetical protein